MFGVAQEVGGAYFVEGLPVLGFVHCLRLQKFRFSSFRVDFFFSERAFAIATKVPLRQSFSFLGKRGKTVGILALGPDRRGLCFHPGICWFSRGTSELGKVLSEKNGKIRVTCRKT